MGGVTSQRPKTTDSTHRRAAHPHPSPLVAASDLLTRLDPDRHEPSAAGQNPGTLGAPPGPLLLDVRWTLADGVDRRGFTAGHLPDAVLVDLDADLAGPPGTTAAASAAGRGGRHPLPLPGMLQDTLRRLGVDGRRPVVVYDAADSTAAARAWWVLQFAGLTDVRVLDGGLAAWTRMGGPVESGEPAGTSTGDVVVDPSRAKACGPVVGSGDAPVGGVAVEPGGMPILDAAGAARVAADGVLLDARSESRFRGEGETVDPICGHIPGARSAPTAGNLLTDGSFLPRKALRDRFAALGVPMEPGSRDRPVVGAYCGSGVTAAHEVLAAAIAGIPAALYVGSWSDWILDPTRPVQTG